MGADPPPVGDIDPGGFGGPVDVRGQGIALAGVIEIFVAVGHVPLADKGLAGEQLKFCHEVRLLRRVV